ncbi:MAG: flagellar hook-length control protein FliK [Phycisphaerae bacterium]
MGRRAVQNSTGPGRLASSTAVQASKAAAPRGGRAGGTAPAAAAGTRSPAKSGPGATGKTSGTRPAQNADWDANIERLVRIVRSRISGERSHTVLRLDPPELGSLRLQMDLRGEMLTLRVDTSTDLAHRLLWEDLNRLRHGLEASGIRLERVEVRPPTQAPEASEHDVSRHADTQEETQGGSAQTDAEHPEERGTDSHPAGSTEGARRGTDSEPAAESLVNVVA